MTGTGGADARGKGGAEGGGGGPGGAGRRGADPRTVLPVAVAPARTQDFIVWINALGNVAARNTVTVRPRVDGQLAARALRGGPAGEGGRPARGDRPASVPGAGRTGERPARARPGATRERAHRPRALPDAARSRIRSRSSRSTPRRRWCGSSKARSKRISGAVDNAQAAAVLHAHHRAGRRPHRACARSTPATWCGRPTRTASSSSRRCSRSACCSRCPRISLVAVHAARAIRRDGGRRRMRPRRQDQAGERQARHRRQPDRPDDRHHQAQGRVRQREPGALPEPVRQRAAAARHAEGRDRGAELRRSSAARRARSSTASTTTTR